MMGVNEPAGMASPESILRGMGVLIRVRASMVIAMQACPQHGGPRVHCTQEREEPAYGGSCLECPMGDHPVIAHGIAESHHAGREEPH